MINKWKQVKLGSLITLEYGKGLPASKRSNGNFPVYGSNGIVGCHDEAHVKRGIVVGRKGSIGKTEYVDTDFWPIDTTYFITDDQKYNLKWMYYLLQTLNLNMLNRATGVPSLNRDDVYKILVLYPELKTQQKIADILSSVDEAIQKTDQIIQKTGVLKQGLMNELLTKGIRHKKFKMTKLGKIPEEWEILTMKDICTVRQGLQIAIKQRKHEPGTNRYVYITNQYLKDLEKPEYVENPLKSVISKEEDILMTRTGNTGQVVTDVHGVFHNNYFLVDFDRSCLNKNFLLYYLQKPNIQKMIMDRAGTTTIPDLNHGDFYSLPILIPEKTEQNDISEIISFVIQKIRSEKKNLERLMILKKGLIQDIFSQKVQIN